MGLAFVDRSHRFVLVNEAFAAMTGLTVAEHTGRRLDEVHGQSPSSFHADVDWVFANGRAVVDREQASGAGRHWVLSHFPVEVDGGVLWVGTVAVEVTALRRAEGERLDLLAAERRTRTAAERLAERLARLQAVTSRLTGAVDAEEVAKVVCDHGAAGLGAESGALMLLIDEGTRFEMVRQHGYRREIEDEFRFFPADAPLPAADAVRDRAMVLLADLAERDRRYPSLASTPMEHQAHAVVPLQVDDRMLGAVSFAFRAARQFDDDDRRFLLALASQASQALERARLYAAERVAARHQELLAEASRRLVASPNPADELHGLTRLVTEDLADACEIHLRDDQGWQLAASTGDVDGDGADGFEVEVPLIALGVTSGTMVLARAPARHRFSAADVAFARDLGDRIAAALAHARAHRAREEQSQTLQASLLPPRLPEIPGLTIDSRYQPIGDGSLVGGDFYDVFPLADGRWGVMIGDVCGQGVEAAALTSLVRYTARAAARQWTSPAAVLRFTNGALGDHDLGERFCTVVLCVVEPTAEGALLTVASGGHHPPLLHRDGVVTPVGRAGAALGLFDDAQIDDETIALRSGDLLVLYTDGVVEAREPDGEQVREGFLEDIVLESAVGGPALVGATVERRVLELGGGRARDDMAVVVVGVGDLSLGDDATDRGGFERRYAANPESVREARTALRAWLDRRSLVPARADDLLVALTELVTNATRSARTAIEVRAWSTPDAVHVEVIDDGAGFDPAVPHDARDLDPLAERGRGLFLVAALADECTIESGPTGTIVRCAVARTAG